MMTISKKTPQLLIPILLLLLVIPFDFYILTLGADDENSFVYFILPTLVEGIYLIVLFYLFRLLCYKYDEHEALELLRRYMMVYLFILLYPFIVHIIVAMLNDQEDYMTVMLALALIVVPAIVLVPRYIYLCIRLGVGLKRIEDKKMPLLYWLGLSFIFLMPIAFTLQLVDLFMENEIIYVYSFILEFVSDLLMLIIFIQEYRRIKVTQA